MTELPRGWARLRLDEIADVRLGRQRSPRNHAGDKMRPYLRAANVDWAGLKLDDVMEMNFTDEEMETYRLQPGDIVLNEASGSPGEVGKPALWMGEIADCAIQNTLIRVRPRHAEPRYLLHYFRHLARSRAFADESRGVGIHHIGRTTLAEWQVPLPSLEEQRRIVDVLEDHLSRLDQADRLLRESGDHARVLADLIIRDQLDRVAGAPTRLEDMALKMRNGIFVSRAKPVGQGVPILRIGAVRPLQLDLDDLRSSERSEPELRREDSLLLEGDLVFTRYNGNPRFVGACAVVGAGTGPLTYPDKLIRVVADKSKVLPGFLALACSVGSGRAQIQARVKTTSGQSGISGRDLKQVEIRLPSLDAQESVVRAASTAIGATRFLTDSVAAQLRRSGALRQSLLEAAFTGRLTGRHEGTQEPTHV